jgi:hypothetical protein
VQAQDKLGFVFELIRHGGRAPLSYDGGKFLVRSGDLTEVGMRQKLIAGKINRKQYIEDLQFLD